MEQVVAHLQAVASDSALAQFQQWLRTYLLYASETVTPPVQVVDVPATSPATRRPALQQITWKRRRLQLTSHLLREMPPRLLALLARLNRLREEHGYPKVQREHLQPPSPPAVDKDEQLRRHPPDEYRQVHKVRM